MIRYHQLVLHDPVWYDHLPYIPFPSHWPIFTPKDKLAEWFESYSKLLELNIWTQTNLESASWDGSKRQWTVNLERKVRIFRSKSFLFGSKTGVACHLPQAGSSTTLQICLVTSVKCHLFPGKGSFYSICLASRIPTLKSVMLTPISASEGGRYHRETRNPPSPHNSSYRSQR